MAIVFDAANSDQGETVSSITFSLTTAGDDRYLYAVGYQNDNTDLTGITYNSDSLDSLWSEERGGDQRCAGFGKEGLGAATANVVVSFGASADSSAGAISVTGVDQTTPERTPIPTPVTGVSTTPSITITSATGELVLDGMGAENNAGGSTPIAGAGQTARWTEIAFATLGSGGSTEAGATSVTMSWTITSDDWIIGAISVIPAAEAGEPSVGSLMLVGVGR